MSYESEVEEGTEPAYDEDIIGKIDRDQDAERLNKAISLLPERLRQVVIFRFIEDMSAREVAEIMDISEVNVRVLQHRALLKLKEILEK